MKPDDEIDERSKQSKKFDELKKIIRSIVIPYQNGIKVGILLRDYKEIEGCELPHREFGFQSVHHLLQSMPDVVRFDHNKHADFVLFPVADENTIHIQTMVKEQKKAPGPPRRPNSSSGRAMTNSMLSRYRSAPQIQRPLVPRFNNHSQFAIPPFRAPLLPSPNFPYHQSFVPLSNSNNWNQRLPTPAPYGTPILGRNTDSSIRYQSNSGVPQIVQNNVTIMLTKFHCGLHLKDFPSFYMHDFKCAFNYQAYGFDNLDDCLRSLTNICIAEDGTVCLKKPMTAMTAIPNSVPLQMIPNLSKVVSTRPMITRTTTASNIYNNGAVNGVVNVTKTTTTTSVTVATQQAAVTLTSTAVTTTVSSLVTRPRPSSSSSLISRGRQDFDWNSWLKAKDSESDANANSKTGKVATQHAAVTLASTIVTTTVSSLVTRPRPSFSSNLVSQSRQDFDWNSWLKAKDVESNANSKTVSYNSNNSGNINVTISNNSKTSAMNADWDMKDLQKSFAPNEKHVHLNGTIATTSATSDCDASAMKSRVGDTLDGTIKTAPMTAKKLMNKLSNLRKTKSTIIVTAVTMASTVNTVTTSTSKTTTSVTQSENGQQLTKLRRPNSMVKTLENKQSGQGSHRVVTNNGNICEVTINRNTDGHQRSKMPSTAAIKRFASKGDVRTTEQEWPISPPMSSSISPTKLAPAGSYVTPTKDFVASGDNRSQKKVEEWLRRNENLKKGNEVLIKKAEMGISASELPSIQSTDIIVDAIDKFPPQVISKFKRMIACHPNGIPATEFLDDYEKETGFEMNPLDWGIATPIQVFYSLPSVFAITPPDIDNQMQFEGSENDHILYDATNVPEDVQRLLSGLPNRKPRIPAGYEVSKGMPIEENVKIRILKLLHTMDEGILISDFGCIYQINFRENIVPEKWRYETFFELFCALSLELPISVRSGCEPKVCLESQLFSEWLQKRITEHRYSALKMFVDFPGDSVLPGETMSTIEIPSEVIMDESDDEQPLSWVPVLITSAINPSSFWVHIKGEQFNEALNQLMVDLEFYEKEDADRYRVPPEFVVKGLICCSRFPGDKAWHRVRITRVHMADKVTVFYVDYGGLALIDRKDLRLLKREFFGLKQQAIHVSLKGLKPKGSGAKAGKWSIESRQLILDFSNNDYWLACLFYPKNSRDKYEVALCDTNGDVDVYVDAFLIEKGVGERVNSKSVVEEPKDLNNSVASSASKDASNLSFSARIKKLAKKSVSTRHLDSMKLELSDEANLPQTLRDVLEMERKLKDTNFFEDTETFSFYANSSSKTEPNLFPGHEITGKEVILSLGKVNFAGEKKINVFSIDDNVYVFASQINDLLKEVNVWKHIAETSFELETLVLDDGKENILKVIKLDDYAKPGVVLYMMKGVMHNLEELRRTKEVSTFKTFFQKYNEKYANCAKRRNLLQSITRHHLT